MLKTTSHIRTARHILLMWFVLFALSPCIVKETLFSGINVEYAQPLNKSKTTTPTNSCQYSQNDNRQISVVKQSNINKQTEPVDISGNQHWIARSAKIYGNHSKTFPGNSPPKYILYKRLKIAIV